MLIMKNFIKFSLFAFLISSQNSFAKNYQKIISVGGSLTEIIFQLNLEDKLIGVDTTSNFPEKAKTLKKIGYKRNLSSEGILSLKPDLVILNDEAGPTLVIEQIKNSGVEILKLKSARSISEIKENINQIAKKFNKKREAKNLINKINYSLEKLNKKIAKQKDKQKIMFILGHGGSLMVSGKDTAGDAIIKISGAKNAISDFSGYRILTPESVIKVNPDIILIGKNELESLGGKKSLLKNKAISLTNAAKNNRIISMDLLLLLGFGPRTVEAAEKLNESIYAK
jgi:iron complex transport system substrate-binding protein